MTAHLWIGILLDDGLGCALNLASEKLKGTRWVENKGLPVAAGFIVGDAIVGVIYALIRVISGLMAQ